MKLNTYAIRGLSLSGFICFWWLVSHWLNQPELPSPLAVLGNLYEQIFGGDMLNHLGVTLLRVAASFVIAMAVGCAIGIWMGHTRRVDIALDSLLVLALNIPALVTIILCYIWFGLSEVAAITAVVLNKVPNVAVTVREGARAIDHRLLDVATVFKVSRWRMLTTVYLPQLYPYFMASARTGLSLIWKIVLVVELLGRSDGVGFQLGTYFQFFDITGILAYTFAFATVVLLIEALALRPLERQVERWRA